MADQELNTDQIRAKRLAKLRETVQKQPKPGVTPDPTIYSQSSDGENLIGSEVRNASLIAQGHSTDSGTSVSGVTPNAKRPVANSGGKGSDSLASRGKLSRPQESASEWEHRTLCALFRITLDPDLQADVHNQPPLLLSELRRELENDAKPLRLRISQDVLEPALVEAASHPSQPTPLEYLLACWKRTSKLNRSIKNSQSEPFKLSVIKEARRLCINYCILSISVPALFGQQDHESENAFVRHLLHDPESELGLDTEFLQEITGRISDQESGIKEIVIEAVEQLSEKLSLISMNDDYQSFVRALLSLSRFPALVTAISESPKFVPPDVLSQNIEKLTILGPFFGISPLQSQVASNYFSSVVRRDQRLVLNSQNALRITLQQHQSDMFEIVDHFIKNKDSREAMLDWFAMTINANHRRRAMRADPRTVSSDGFMINVTVCLDKLSEPFMDASLSKIDRIDVNYLRRLPRVRIDDETKLNADQATSEAFYSETAPGKSNFISEIFFLTAAAHHYGTEATQTKLSDEKRSLKHMDEEIERFESERTNYSSNQAALALFDQRLKALKDNQERRYAVVYATEGVLFDESLQSRAMSVMRYIVSWMLRVASGVDFPRETFRLPLPLIRPAAFSCLPEYLLEDIVDHFKFVTNHMPAIVSSSQCEELVMLCVAFLRNSEYIKNPGLKSGLVAILFYGIHPTRTSTNGPLGAILNSHEFALQHLLHALMKFFIECESTGTHTQFYDKFNTRYEIFQVIKCVWGNRAFREQLENEASHNNDFFVRFVNLLLNDATYLLDEVFSSFQKIASLERELGIGRHASAAPTPVLAQEATEKQQSLQETKRKAKSYMSLTIETVAMLRQFTDSLATAFTAPEIVQRLADMLDYNLDALVGAKRGSLKVENPDEYNFHPGVMLSDLMDVFLNLSNRPSFHLAVARDGRSYKPENFTETATILSSLGLKSAEELVRWNTLGQAVATAKAKEDAEEEDMGEIPEEFLDPLLATLMVDPVILPTSKIVVDRSTIRQMLLSDSHDPFNRAPLSIEDVVDDIELRGRIESFRGEKKRKRKLEA